MSANGKDLIIRMDKVCMAYGSHQVLFDISMDIGKREFLTILGPSGCGKSTILRLIGGFETPILGEIYFEGEPFSSVPPYKRPINTVFQKYSLFSHLNVFENIAFGLRIRKLPETVIREKVERMLTLVNLKGFEKRNVHSLSGGQQQRVAIARALVNEPKVLLLDEPLGALDLYLRKEMQLELKNMQTSLGITFIYVTHDQEEALTMSDTVVVMNQGRILQMGTPEEIYNEPRNVFTSRFIGESNIFEGFMPQDGEVVFCGIRVPCVDGGFSQNEPVYVLIRPEDIQTVHPQSGILKGKVQSVVFKGVHYEMIIREDGRHWMIHSTKSLKPGEEIGLYFTPEDIHVMKRNGQEA